MLVLLSACGGGDASVTRKAQTATAGAASDAATVTAFAQSRATGTPGGQGSSAGTAGTAAAGSRKGPIFTFSTIAAGGAATGRNATPGATARANATPASRATAAGVRGSTYTDPQGRFTFQIPSGWVVQQPSTGAADVEVAPQNLRGALRLASDTMPPDASLSDYASAVLDNIQTSFSNFQLVSGPTQQATTFGGQPAVRYEFTGTQSGTDLHGVVYVVNKDATVYGIFIAAATADFNALIAQVKPLIDSFTFL
jgi:hypothetical protein